MNLCCLARALHCLFVDESLPQLEVFFALTLRRQGGAAEFVWSDPRCRPRAFDVWVFLDDLTAALDLSDEEKVVAWVIFENYLRALHCEVIGYRVFRQAFVVCSIIATKLCSDESVADFFSEFLCSPKATCIAALEAHVLRTIDWRVPLDRAPYDSYLQHCLQ